jgi:flagellar biogenesis protein FliO
MYAKSMHAKSISAPSLPSARAPRLQGLSLVRSLPGFRLLSRLLSLFAGSADSADRALAVEERVAIGQKKSLLVVRCHGQRYLIATAGDTVGPFLEIAPPKPVSPKPVPPKAASGKTRRRSAKEPRS